MALAVLANNQFLYLPAATQLVENIPVELGEETDLLLILQLQVHIQTLLVVVCVIHTVRLIEILKQQSATEQNMDMVSRAPISEPTATCFLEK